MSVLTQIRIAITYAADSRFVKIKSVILRYNNKTTLSVYLRFRTYIFQTLVNFLRRWKFTATKES